jgi:hypothetical protein
MKAVNTLFTVLLVLSISCLPVLAGGSAKTEVALNAPSSFSAAPLDKELSRRGADFEKFVKLKVGELNRNLRYSRDRMEVQRLADGSYRARFHEIDPTSLRLKVKRSQSRSIPYVGVLSYREQVFETLATAPNQFKRARFDVVQIIPNRHIFSYRKGHWN